MKVPPPELTGGERVAPTIEEAARLLLAAEQTDPDFALFLWVAAETGGRRGEALALRWGDVDAERGSITISSVVSAGMDGVQVRSRTKTGKPRTIAVSALTLQKLSDHRTRVEAEMSAIAGRPVELEPGALVFNGGLGSRRRPHDGRPWRPDSTTRRFKRLKAQAGVREQVDLHGLRHTMITELLGAGVEPRTVMQRAGHASEAMTMAVYGKVRPAADAVAADRWGSPARREGRGAPDD